MNDDQEAIKVLEEYLEKTSSNLESIGYGIDRVRVIAGNIQNITDKMQLVLYQMDVLTDMSKLKGIYNLTHEEWVALSVDEMLDLVEQIDEVPCQEEDEERK